jgi:elongation factor Ts
MKITAKMVKDLRDTTSAGMMDCKKALGETEGDFDKAVDLLRQKGLAVAAKRAGRETSEGTIECYIHAGGKIAAMVELSCESDFVAKTDEFKDFARNLALHVAAVNPVAISKEDVPEEVLAREKEIYIQQALDSGKPENIVEKMVGGKMDKFLKEICLLDQPYVKDPDFTIQQLITDLVGKLGEAITIKRFSRFQVGA